jgi:hypothetical protein
MPSTKGGSGRPRKSSSAKKPLKQPIPIDSGTSQTTSSINPDHPQTQEFPGIEEEIRVRAYALYEERGRQDGLDREDWVRAETEILAKYRKNAKTA